MIRFEYALIVSTATAAATLAYSPTEPYAAIITVLLPPVFVLAWSGLRGAARGRAAGPRSSASASSSASPRCSTRCCSATPRSPGDHGAWCSPSRAAALEPLLRLAVIAVIAGADRADRLAAVPAGRDQRHRPPTPARAQHYLPLDGAQLTFPMLQFTLLGALCMLGTLWLVVRARSSTRAGALAFGVLAVYAVVAAVDADHAGRHHAAVLPAAADADGAARPRRARSGSSRSPCAVARPRTARHGRRIVVAAATVGAIGAHDVQPGHPRRAALRHRRRLHRHRRLRPARRPPPARRRAVLPRDRREDPAR